ncbi:MAG: hypothetical protein ABI432_17235 [Flavobacteriales bacterium]
MSSAETGTLRVGVLCDQQRIPRWQAEAVTRLFAVAGVHPLVWIALEDGAARPAALKQKTPVATGIFAQVTKWLPKPLNPAALFEQDPAPLFGTLRTIVVPASPGLGAFDPEAIATLAPLQLDLVLALSSFRPEAAELGHPRLGVWSFHPTLSGDAIDEELFSDTEHAAVQLIRYDATGDVRVLREGRFANTAIDAPVNEVLMRCALWPAQVAMEVIAGREEAARGSAAALAPESAPQSALASAAAVWRGWRRKLFRQRPELALEWNIGVLHQPISALLEEGASMNVRWLPPPSAGRTRSEPFGYTTEDGQLNVLYRKHSVTTGQSSIARLRPKADNVLKRSRPMLEGAGITGYPYVVEHEGAVHVVVTHTTGTDLYRLNTTNDGLDHLVSLVAEPLHAPTLFQVEGRWWLFATDPALPDIALLAFHANDLQGPYTAHALNPLKMDVTSSRPAGTPFQRDGVWWRPALDASRPDTSAVVLNRIVILTPDLYVEETVRRIEAFRGTTYGRGLRTLCAMGPITLVDGLRSPIVSADKATTSRSKKRSGSSSKRK